MALFDLLSWLNPRRRRADRAREELKENAEKALRMKQESETGPQTPPHQTAHEGMHPLEDADRDHTPSREGSFTPERKRSSVARSSDIS